jgi:deoxyribose-phosphate aldolase
VTTPDRPSSPDAANLAVAYHPPLSAPMVELRCATLATRSVKAAAQAAGVELAIACMDLTSLEGGDSPGRVRRLAARAATPDPADPNCPRPAAVCVYPDRVGDARAALDAAGAPEVAVAAVAAGFPVGLTPLAARQAEIDAAVAAGAAEIDTVLDRAAFLAGDLDAVRRRVAAEREACGPAHLKVIVESAELGSLAAVYDAALVAALAGADFVKTSTGKGPGGATLPAAFALARAARAATDATGRVVGVKVSGGVRTAKQALQYALVVADVLGPDALVPSRFRLGASSLLDDLVAQRRFHATGRYHGSDYFPSA